MDSLNISATTTAKDYIKKILTQNQALKLNARPSGCSGYRYDLGVIEKNDALLQQNNQQGMILNIDDEIDVYVESKYANVFQDIVIDYIKEGLSSRIDIKNPNVTNVCGCGESFQIK
jgi:iron-sulfur cluster assembly accessory protein